jgi:hypothetical protein
MPRARQAEAKAAAQDPENLDELLDETEGRKSCTLLKRRTALSVARTERLLVSD